MGVIVYLGVYDHCVDYMSWTGFYFGEFVSFNV